MGHRPREQAGCPWLPPARAQLAAAHVRCRAVALAPQFAGPDSPREWPECARPCGPRRQSSRRGAAAQRHAARVRSPSVRPPDAAPSGHSTSSERLCLRPGRPNGRGTCSQQFSSFPPDSRQAAKGRPGLGELSTQFGSRVVAPAAVPERTIRLGDYRAARLRDRRLGGAGGGATA